MKADKLDFGFIKEIKKIFLNHHYEEIKKNTINWLEEKKLFNINKNDDFCFKFKEKIITRVKFSYFTSICYFEAKKEDLQLMNDFINFIFLFDDYFENSNENAHKIKNDFLNILSENYIKQDEKDEDYYKALFIAWKDFSKRWNNRVSQNQKENFYKYFEGYLNTAIDFIKLRKENNNMTEKKYLELRSYDIVVYPLLIFYELIYNFPIELLNDEKIFRLRKIVVCNVIGINDIFSIEKDKKNKDKMNWIFIIEKEKKITEDEAIKYIINHLKKEIKEFTLISELILKEKNNQKDYLDFIECLKTFIVSDLDWHMETSRYREINN